MIGPFMTETVTRIRSGAPTRDAYGNDVEGPAEEVTISGCAVLPPSGQTAPTVELTAGRDQVVIARVLFAPAGTDLRPTDRIRHAGRVYEVDGEPSPYPGQLAHIEANLKAVNG
ncbi:head-tail adaptor protein [Streptomyces sp. CB03911]|uniref:phage head completion protein n=1 Tax=Streptomyces sp. CB03911 TaxID=1804758 RepID=UPI00095C3777|nr:head-tail adaptor protein [Streptomyces sp. CB03911]OKI19314.1 hypothetical protein A6A07_07375 [Streptomyces sp. CB03911]